MKNRFAKKVLVFGAVVIGLSAVVPAQAMESAREVREEAMNSTTHENENKLRQHMRKLEHEMKEFFRCVRNGQNCTKTQKNIRNTLYAIMAIVGVLTVVNVGTGLHMARTRYGYGQETYEKATKQAKKAYGAVTNPRETWKNWKNRGNTTSVLSPTISQD